MRRASKNLVRVRSPQATRLRELLVGGGVSVVAVEPGVLEVAGLTAAEIGETAAANQIVLHELAQQSASLEEAFMTLTSDGVEFKAVDTAPEREAA